MSRQSIRWEEQVGFAVTLLARANSAPTRSALVPLLEKGIRHGLGFTEGSRLRVVAEASVVAGAVPRWDPEIHGRLTDKLLGALAAGGERDAVARFIALIFRLPLEQILASVTVPTPTSDRTTTL